MGCCSVMGIVGDASGGRSKWNAGGDFDWSVAKFLCFPASDRGLEEKRFVQSTQAFVRSSGLKAEGGARLRCEVGGPTIMQSVGY
jgi:hypothetical protein